MAALAPLAMSQTKDDLLKHLDMSLDTYTLMAKETDRVYRWLTSEKRHLKKNCKRKPPYDWSDIVEKSKDEAMELIAQSGDPHTSYYWSLAIPSEDCPNWIARWFLYHKFRYRDGRNRHPAKEGDGRYSHSKHTHHKHTGGSEESYGYYDNRTPYYPVADTGPQGYSYESVASPSLSRNYGDCSSGHRFDTSARNYTQHGQGDEQSIKTYYDPVRDV